MAEQIKESEIPVRDSLSYVPGFDADGNWGKMEPVTAKDIEGVQAEATSLASFMKPGRVGGVTFDDMRNGITINDIYNKGAVVFDKGVGIPAARLLGSFNFGATAIEEAGTGWGTPFYIRGMMSTGPVGGGTNYGYGYAKRMVQGILFIVNGTAVVIEYNYGEIWIGAIGSTEVASWRKVGGSDYTLPVATSDTLGGVKSSGTIAVADDGTASIPSSVNLPGSPMASDNGINIFTQPSYNDQRLATISNIVNLYRSFAYTGEYTTYPVSFRTITPVENKICFRIPSPEFYEEFSAAVTANSANIIIRLLGYNSGYKDVTLAGLTAGQSYRINVIAYLIGKSASMSISNTKFIITVTPCTNA